MLLPDVIDIFGYRIYTFGIFLILGFLFTSFVIWHEGRKDGFDEDKLFDLLLLVTITGLLFGRIGFALRSRYVVSAFFEHVLKFWTGGLDIFGAFFGALVSLYLVSRLWKWSVYRIFDIFSLAVSLGLSITMLGYIGIQRRFEFLLAFGSWLLLYAVLSKFRNTKIKSGVVFSIFLFANVFLGVLFFNSLYYLIFYGLLVTLSMLNLFFRVRKKL